MADVAAQVVAIIARQARLTPDQVALQASPQDLGLDSLGLVEVIFAIEEAFDVAVPFNANNPGANEPGAAGFDISSVGSVIAAVQALVAAKA